MIDGSSNDSQLEACIISTQISHILVSSSMFQKTVADHVFLLGLGSRCDIADVLRTSQLDVEDKCSFAEWAC